MPGYLRNSPRAMQRRVVQANWGREDRLYHGLARRIQSVLQADKHGDLAAALQQAADVGVRLDVGDVRLAVNRLAVLVREAGS